jgi:glycosyltransferase involved in cell wall biosynthesis
MQISIAMCTYNGGQYLQRQLESFAAQTLLPCELVVCDDGSLDDTVELIEHFASGAPFPVRVFRNEVNLGSAKNFEKAIGLCKGDLIALSDQDDEWPVGKLGEFKRVFADFPGALAAFGDADIIDDHSVFLRRNLWDSVHFSPKHGVPYLDSGILESLFRLNNFVTGSTLVFRKHLCSKVIPIPVSWVHDGWIAWAAALRGGLAVVPTVKIRYRVHSRQQLGLDSQSFIERLAFARQNGTNGYQSLIRQFLDTKRYLEQQCEDVDSTKIMPRIDGKLRLLRGRSSLPSSFFERVCWILSSWRGYRDYARGPISMLKDSLFPSREIASERE